MARIQRSLPGHSHATHFQRRRPQAAHCPITGLVLNGIPRKRPAQLAKLPKTARSVSRYYGGKIHHKALSSAIRSKVLEMYEQP